MRYQLRPCTDADREWAYALKTEAYRAVVERQFGPWDEAFQRDLFVQRCWRPAISHRVFVGDEPVGLIACEERGDHLWLDEIQVVRAERGRGLGTLLVRDLVARAQARGKPLRLQVLRENRRAQALYLRLGFVQTGETPTHFRLEHRGFAPSAPLTLVLDQSCAALLDRVAGLAPTFVFARRAGPFTDPGAAAEELHEALMSGGHRPPYLLAAASFAGFTALHFARRFPESVSGIVLVDSSHPRQSATLLAALPVDLPASAELDAFKAFLRGFGPAWERSCAALSGDVSLGDIPLIVLAAGTQAMPASLPASVQGELLAAWHGLQREHAARSTRGELRIVPGSGHAIVHHAPDAVATAIADVLMAAKAAAKSRAK